jgi:muramoyltetrapeptide carboxypeptidase
VRYLEALGYRVRTGPHLDARQGYLAGSDEQRAADLNAMLRDRRVKAIMATRGGYGTPRLLRRVDYEAVQRQPKILVGYSDLTALQMALFRRTGLVTFSGPMAAVEFGEKPDPFTEEHFWRAVTSAKPLGPMVPPGGRSLRPRRAGRATGRLLGGNLSMIVSSMGTPFSPAYRRALLVLEEVNEPVYRIDRLLTQLRNAEVLDGLQGLLFGRFTRCQPTGPKRSSLSLPDILAQAVEWAGAPAVDGVPCGHAGPRWTLPWGVRARLDATEGTLELLESGVV